MFLFFSYPFVNPYLVPSCLALYRLEPMEKLNIVEAQNKFNLFIYLFIYLLHYFQTSFHDADFLLYYPQTPVFSIHTFVVLLYSFLINGAWI